MLAFRRLSSRRSCIPIQTSTRWWRITYRRRILASTKYRSLCRWVAFRLLARSWSGWYCWQVDSLHIAYCVSVSWVTHREAGVQFGGVLIVLVIANCVWCMTCSALCAHQNDRFTGASVHKCWCPNGSLAYVSLCVPVAALSHVQLSDDGNAAPAVAASC